MTETTTATVTYRKTKQGVWVVCGPTAVVKPGEDVVVTLKSGATKTEHVQSVGKAFTTADGELVYGYIAPKGAPAKPVDFRPMGAKECGEPAALVAASPAEAPEMSLPVGVVEAIHAAVDAGASATAAVFGAGKAAAAAPKPYGFSAPKGEVHVIDGTYYRVSRRHHGKGAAYLNKWVTYAGGKDGKWIYAGGMIYKITAETVATAAQVAEYGKAFKRCVFCSLALDTPESITAGYGPVCAKNYHLPWGHVVQLGDEIVPETALVNLGDGLILANAAAPSKQYEESLW